MIKNMRDFAIFILTVYIFSVMISARLDPEWVGHWEARKDIAYDSIWGEYIMDCDCTEPLE